MEVKEEKKNVDRNLMIIDLVEMYPCLYRKKLNAFKQASNKTKIWEEITDIYNCNTGDKEDVKAIQQRWASLKARFTKEHKIKNKYVPSGSEALEETPDWDYYYQMMFLDGHIRHRRTGCNFNLAANNAFAERGADDYDDAEDEDEDAGIEQGADNAAGEVSNNAAENIADNVDKAMEEAELHQAFENVMDELEKKTSDDSSEDEGDKIIKKCTEKVENFLQQAINFAEPVILHGYEKNMLQKFRKLPLYKRRNKFNRIMAILEDEN